MKVETPFVRMLRRERAATYCGVSPTTFDAMVKAGALPLPRRLGSVKAWDRFDLDAVLDALPVDGAEGNAEGTSCDAAFG